MPTATFAFEPGGAPRVELQWEGNRFENTRVLVDGALLGTFEDRDAIFRGESWPLADGSRLSVRLTKSFFSAELQLLRDGVPLPGSSSDPAKRVKAARQLLAFLAVINGLFGLLSMGPGMHLEKTGLGPMNIVLGLLYGGFALLAGSSRAAMLGAIALVGGDSLLVLYSAVTAEKGMPWLMLLVRASIIVSLIRAVEGPAPPAPARWVLARRALLVLLLGLEAVVLLLTAVGTFIPAGQEEEELPSTIELAPEGEFQAKRASYKTRLTRSQPSPQPFDATPPPSGIEPVTIQSGALQLAGLYARPAGAPSERRPGVVYLHGGFAFGADDLPEARAFLEAGYPVLFASLRGENGNPGSFELMYGELDDAAAAVRWLAARPEVDPSRVFAFGHSSGGGVAGLLALVPELPLVASGSAGGLYTDQVFFAWKDFAPFDVNDAQERRLRVLLPHLASMKRPHFAYVGKEDGQARLVPLVEASASRLAAPLHVRVIDGDHHSSLQEAERLFIRDIIRTTPPRP